MRRREEELVRAEARRRGERRRAFASVSRQRDRETRGCREVIGRWRGPRHRARYTSASPRLRANQSSARAWWLRPWTPAFEGERLGVGRMRASPRRSVNILFFPPPSAATRNDIAPVET